MLKKFLHTIHTGELFTKKDKLLLAVSGGVDSMVLCDLLLKGGYDFSIAHCNFKLRAKASDLDEKLVAAYAKEHALTLHSTSFNTQEYATAHHLSIQMAARELRYNYFYSLVDKYQYTHILTAHHLDDSVETFFINLSRGTGIKGMTGIKERSEKLIRPLISFTKQEILTYAKQHAVSYRNDQSNEDDKYTRNFLRLHIIPKFKEMNPAFEQAIKKQLELLKQYDLVLENYVKEEIKKIITKEKDSLKIKIEPLLKCLVPELVMFEILKPYGFSGKETEKIIATGKGIAGKKFRSANYELVKDREFFILHRINTVQNVSLLIHKEIKEIRNPIALKFSTSRSALKDGKNFCVYINKQKLVYPLTLRKWQTGDKMKPLGLKGSKKISDIFKEAKLNAIQKSEQWLLVNGNNEVIWVLGLKFDDRYKVTAETKNILKAEYIA